MRVLLVASDKGELKGFDDSYIKAVSGVGPIMAAATTATEIALNHPDIVFSIGSAGALSADLKIGKAYSFGSVVTPDQDLSSFHIKKGSTLDPNRTTVGDLFSNDRYSHFVLGSSGTFSKLLCPWHKLLQVSAADMEGYGVALACHKAKVPFFLVKLITDIVGDDSTIGNVQFQLREGRERMVSLVETLIH